MNFLITNGQIVKSEEFIPFRYNEPFVLTRKVWYGFGGIPLFKLNLQSIKQELTLLKMAIPVLMNDENEFYRLVKRMLNKSKFYRSGYLFIKVFAEPEETKFIVECNAFEEFDFPFSRQGKLVNFSDVPVFSGNDLSRFAFYNTLQWKIAEITVSQTPVQNSIFLNENENVVQGIASNLFAIKGREFFTPSAETGCYIDLIRSLVIETALKSGLKMRETANLKKGELVEMDEIFLASEAGGIQWIMGIGNKRFVQKFAGLIHARLNEALKQLT